MLKCQCEPSVRVKEIIGSIKWNLPVPQLWVDLQRKRNEAAPQKTDSPMSFAKADSRVRCAISQLMSLGTIDEMESRLMVTSDQKWNWNGITEIQQASNSMRRLKWHNCARIGTCNYAFCLRPILYLLYAFPYTCNSLSTGNLIYPRRRDHTTMLCCPRILWFLESVIFSLS